MVYVAYVYESMNPASSDAMLLNKRNAVCGIVRPAACNSIGPGAGVCISASQQS
jgi:hypothetical protein